MQLTIEELDGGITRVVLGGVSTLKARQPWI
jgi:hypothetical protein